MAVRGETIGTAYVRILADGSGLPRSVQKEMRKTEPEMRQQGSRGGKAYREGFEDEIGRGKNINTVLLENLQKGAGRFDGVGEFLGSRTWQAMRDELERRFPKDIGAKVAANLGEALQSGEINFAGLAHRLENLRPEVAKATRQIQEFHEEMDKGGNAFTRFAKRSENLGSTFGRVFGKGSRNNFLNFVGSIMGGLASLPGAFIGFIGTAISVVKDGFETMSKFSKAFWTSLVNNVAQGENALIAFGIALGEAVGGGAATTAATGGLNLVVMFVTLDAAMVAVVLTAGIMAAALSTLAGIITALAGTITFALIGALGAIAPLIIPIAAAIGGVVLAFQEMKDKSSQWKSSINEVKKSFKDLGDVMKKEMFANADKQADLLSNTLKKLSPLAKAAGEGMRKGFDAFFAGLDNPAFQSFIDAVTDWLPGAMEKLGSIMSNTFGGFGGMVRALLPFATQLLDWLNQITGSFSAWANSAKGQTAIGDFMTKAEGSLKSIWGFLKEVGGLIWDFISAGQGTGNTIFDDMATKLQEIRAWVQSEKGQASLKQWFEDSLGVARELGNLVSRLAGLFDRLDTPENRKALQAIIRLMGSLVVAVSETIVVIANLGLIIVQIANLGLKAFLKLVEGVLWAASKIPGPWQSANKAALKSFQDFEADAMAGMDELEGGIKALADTAKNTSIALTVDNDDAMTDIADVKFRMDELHDKTITITTQHVSGSRGKQIVATGGVFFGPTNALIGEAGPEAVVPLNRPLHLVDPAVRELSAIAQGLRFQSGAVAGVAGPQKVVDVGGITVVSPQADPKAVAAETVNALVAVGY